MHDDESSRTDEKLTHFSEADFIEGEDEDIEHYMFIHDSLDERVVVVLGACEVFDVLASAQLLGRSHLFFEICGNGNSWTDCAGIAHLVYDTC